jgi:hypothetical protein
MKRALDRPFRPPRPATGVQAGPREASRMNRALDRPFRPARPARAGRARARGRAGRGAGRGARGRAGAHRRTDASGDAPAPRGCVDSSRSSRNKTTHPSRTRPGVSTHDGDAGTSRHTRPQVARRRSPRRPGRPNRAPTPGRPPGARAVNGRGQTPADTGRSDPGRPRARVRARVSAPRTRSHTASPAAVQTTPGPPPPNPARSKPDRRPRPGTDHPPQATTNA